MSGPTTIRVTVSPEALIREALEERFQTTIGALRDDPVATLTSLPEPAAVFLARWLDEHGYAIVPKTAEASS